MTESPSHGEPIRRAYRELMARENQEMGHPDDATWEAMAVGTLTGPARAELFDHVVTCERCADIWRGLEALRVETDAGSMTSTAPSAPAASWLRSYAVPLAIAATLVLAVGVVIVQRTPVSSTPGEATTTPGPATAPGWLAAFPISKAEIYVTAEEALPSRGVPAPEGEPPIERLANALEPYRAGDFAEAARRLEPLWHEFPNAGRPALYLGVSWLHVDRAADALAPLRAATGALLPEVAADARWFVAVALAHSGQRDAATTQVRGLCDDGGAGAERACAALKALQESPP